MSEPGRTVNSPRHSVIFALSTDEKVQQHLGEAPRQETHALFPQGPCAQIPLLCSRRIRTDLCHRLFRRVAPASCARPADRRAQSHPAGRPRGRIASWARKSRRGGCLAGANESVAGGTAPAIALPGHGVRAARAGLDAARVFPSPDADLGPHILRSGQESIHG